MNKAEKQNNALAQGLKIIACSALMVGIFVCMNLLIALVGV